MQSVTTAVAWLGATGWTTWHLPKGDGKHTLCGLPVPKQHITATMVDRVCKGCGVQFLDPLI
jgi:hypothetical protein